MRSHDKILKILIDIGTGAIIVAALIQWRIFSMMSGEGFHGPTIFIPMLGSDGINAPRAWGLAFYACTFVFVGCVLLVASWLAIRNRFRR